MAPADETTRHGEGEKGVSAPSISLPKGGGAIRGMGEKFAANPVTGTGSMSVPIATSPGRGGFGPQLSLSYDSGAGNGPFGFGWSLSLPSITRKTDKGLPQYFDTEESDVFMLSGAEDLVPEFMKDADGHWVMENGRHLLHDQARTVHGITYAVRRYRPRIEGLFARIERWTKQQTGEIHWRSITRDNITTVYGKDNTSRIFDPADPDPQHPTRIFSWLICESFDDKGNAIVYQYAAENDRKVDRSQANERNRERAANRYLKRILYGNRISRLLQPDLATAEWLFELVFDYGEHDLNAPMPKDDEQEDQNGDTKNPWLCRPDSFSSYRAGFEVRTYRLCQRVLMFHHFDGEAGVGNNCLVRSTDFTYEQDLNDVRTPIYSFLLSVTQSGYKRQANGYLKRSLPPVEFEYSQPIVHGAVEEVDAESLENLPSGLDGAAYQWTDLHGEGIPGILTEQAGAWFYKRNLSPINGKPGNGVGHVEAKFAPVELVATKPNLALSGGAQFMDLAGDGLTDLVTLDGPLPGLYEHDSNEGWQPFRSFTARLNRDMRDPNLKFMDLDGDGHADVLISEENAFVWHPSLAEDGFGPARRVHQVLDEEKGPRLVFADGTQSIYLADLSGDGLTDLARIRNGEVCYWPNLGYGRFGAKVTMDQAPHFDNPDQFDHKRIRLADIDGSGTTDIIYLHRNGVRLYFNQSGNSWGKPQILSIFPRVDDLVSVVPIDLLGNGTACLVWSSPLPGDARRPMRYVNLMGGQKPEQNAQEPGANSQEPKRPMQKPHLLVSVKNNLGAETRIHYAPSTKFYLQDKQAGKPWITKLPFPVHMVEKVTVTDVWRKTSFTTAYSYHHGYFDGEEREFRGFGRVEQVDVEDYGTFAAGNRNSPYITDDNRLYQPPVKTVTWFHTGAFLDGERIMSHFKDEYFPQWLVDEKPGQEVLGTFQENALPEPDLAALDLTADEWREALRACKGMLLRQEVYELDVDALVGGAHERVKLFSTAYHNCHTQRVQPQASNAHAVFHVTESEAITYHYELDLRPDKLTPDPRIAHTLNLRIDEYGNIQQSVAVVYPRLGKYVDATLQDGAQDLIRQVQSELHLAYTETRYTNDVPDADHPNPDTYRLRLPCEVLTYALTGIKTKDASDEASTRDPVDDLYFTLDELRALKLSDKYPDTGVTVDPISYHLLPNHSSPQKRIVEHARSLFFDTTLDKPLMLGQLNALGLPYESYKLALSDELLNRVFEDKLTLPVKTALADKQTSGYLNGGDLAARFGPNPAGQYWMCAGVAGFAPDAAQHFYLPERYTDPFGNVTTLDYDGRDLYVKSSTDAMGNRTAVTDFDFRLLAPRQMKDANNNLSEVRFDILGMPTAMAVMGEGDEADNLSAFDDALLNPDLAARQDFFVDKAFDVADAKRLLRGASARHVYTFGEVIKDGKTVWGQHPPCACGITREQHAAQLLNSPVQTKFEYSDGGSNVLVAKVQAEPEQPGGPLRWVASGKTILNNKGKPVKQYEPYFSKPVIGHRFEVEEAGHAEGVTAVIYYDAAGRTVRTEMPDGSTSRVEFSPWHVRSFDQNDTVKEPGNAWFASKMAATATMEEKRAAQLAAEHAGTPALTILDSLGRDVISIAHNRVEDAAGVLKDEKYLTFSKLDAEGKPLWIQDSRGNRVMQYVTPPLPPGMHPFDDAQNLNPQGFVPCYDIAGNLLFQYSMDAGDRWMLNDAAGKPMMAWNSRGFITRAEYDELHRPTALIVTDKSGHTFVAERTVYGEMAFGDARTVPAARARARQTNHLGRPYQVYDGAGIVTSVLYDFKGNLIQSDRRLLRDYKGQVNWPELQSPPQPLPFLLEDETFVSHISYDALNRPTQIIAPHSAAGPVRINVTQPGYNEAGLLERLDVWLNRTAEPGGLLVTGTADQHAVKNIDYNAKGQRELIAYGNGATTTYAYDENTFRLTHLRTTRPPGLNGLAPIFVDATVLQDLHYTYDPVGNITHIADAALKTFIQGGRPVEAGCDYTYDPLYRLTAASGREHSGQTGFDFNPPNGDYRDYPFAGQRVHANDLQGLRGYVETYRYDAVGNIMHMAHHAGGSVDQPGQVRWNQRYQYALDSNRLLATSVPGDPDNLPEYVAVAGYSHTYSYDIHGNMTRIPHLPFMQWDFRDQLSATSRQIANNGAPEITYYTYDASGQRVRKVTDRQSGARQAERIYLGGYEIYREYAGNGLSVTLERETLHVMDDKQRIALVETKTMPAIDQRLIRYQLGNHLGSASVELDKDGALVSFEEYHPYGTTAFQVMSAAEVSVKRYRYTGKERDEETGLSYHEARYYAPWLGRWTSCDPAWLSDGINVFAYAADNPIKYYDSTGLSIEDNVKAELIDSFIKKGISYTTELEFYVLDASGQRMINPNTGKPLVGRMDIAWEDPTTGKINFIEGKGGPSSPKTAGQEIYHPEFGKGANWEIKGSKGGNLGLSPGVKGSTKGGGFEIVHSGNFQSFVTGTLGKFKDGLEKAYRFVTVSAEGKRESRYFGSSEELRNFQLERAVGAAGTFKPPVPATPPAVKLAGEPTSPAPAAPTPPPGVKVPVSVKIVSVLGGVFHAINIYAAYKELEALERGEDLSPPNGYYDYGLGGRIISDFSKLPEGFSSPVISAPGGHGPGVYEKRNGDIYKDGKLLHIMQGGKLVLGGA